MFRICSSSQLTCISILSGKYTIDFPAHTQRHGTTPAAPPSMCKLSNKTTSIRVTKWYFICNKSCCSRKNVNNLEIKKMHSFMIKESGWRDDYYCNIQLLICTCNINISKLKICSGRLHAPWVQLSSAKKEWNRKKNIVLQHFLTWNEMYTASQPFEHVAWIQKCIEREYKSHQHHQ